MKKSSIIFNLGILVGLSLFLLFVSNIKIERILNKYVIITYIAIGLCCIVGIMFDKYKFSLNKTFWYFCLFFFFIAPLIQYVTNYYPWKFYIKDEVYFKTNVLILLSFVIYAIVHNVVKCSDKYKEKSKIFSFEKRNLNILFIMSVLSTLIFVAIIGINGILGRKTNSINLENENIQNITNLIFRAIPVFAFSIYYTYCQKKNVKISKMKFIVFCICVLISAFPTSITRFLMGAIYIGLFIIILKNKIGKRTYDILIIVTFLILFPLLYSFKYITITDALTNGVELNGMVETYDSVDFDAYSMLARTVMYTKANGYTYGKQLLSSLLFFVPRSVWHSKPRVTSGLVASAQNAKYTNLSCPFLAEGYIELGALSMLMYIAIFAYFVKKLDYMYWNIDKYEPGIRFIEIIYPFLLGLSIFLLRGSLQPVIVYSFGFFLVLIALYMYLLIKKRYIRSSIK